MKLQPRSSARFNAATESLSSCGPQLPPIAHAPKPISETFHPVRPNVRYFMRAMLPRGSLFPVLREEGVRLYRASTHHARACIIAPVMQHATDTLTKIFAN